MARRARSALLVASLLASVCLAPPVRAELSDTDPLSATPAMRNKAQARFQRGFTLFSAKKYQQAMAEFRASLEIVASPNARLYIARCLRELGELIDAYNEFERVETEAKALAEREPRYAQTAQSAADEQAELKNSLAFVTFAIKNPTPDTTLKIGNEEIQREAWIATRVVMPGTLEITVHAPPDPPKEHLLTLAAGETKTFEVDLAPPPPPPPVKEVAAQAELSSSEKLRPLSYVAGGVGAAGILTFVIAGAMANSTYSSLKSDCNDGPCPPSKADDISAGRTQQTVANVGLVVGLVGLAAGTTLFIVSAPKGTGSQASVVVGPGWVGVRGEM